MKRDLRGAVVVLTGASSGIGRVTARKFAERGARLVLAARDREALDEVARLCEQRGAQALAVVTDVRDEQQVLSLRKAAVERFGGIDVWINDAAVYMLGPFERVPAEQFRALFETNVMGVVHGSQAALLQFREQGRGTLINIGSAAGKASYAQASAYCASKHAVHALHEVLRQELADTDIDACLVAPSTIDTPLFQHAANYTGRAIRAMPPVYSPEDVADAIVHSAQTPRRERTVGGVARAMALMQQLAPALWERLQPRLVEREHLEPEPAPDSAGNIARPLEPHSDSGGWKNGPPRAEPQRPGPHDIQA